MQDHTPAKSLPPFSPTLLASFALRPFPIKLLNPVLTHSLERVKTLYPEIFERLEPLGSCCFQIVPTDFHCRFLFTLDLGKVDIEVVPDNEPPLDADATISGPLLSLFKLLEGRVDGDALFFSRELSVEGDTEAVLTLRNAVDSVDISLDQIFMGQTGPLKPVLTKAVSGISALYQLAQDDLDLVRRSLLDPLSRRIALQDDDLDRQDERFKLIEKDIRKMKASLKRNSAAVAKE